MDDTITTCFNILTGECKKTTDKENNDRLEPPYIYLIPAHYPIYTHDGKYDGIVFKGEYINKEDIPGKLKELL